MSYLISALIFFSCTAYISGKPFDVAQLLVFKVAVPIIWLLGLSLKPVRNVTNVWLNALVGFIFIGILFLKGQPQMISLEPMAYIIMAVMLFYTMSNHLKSIKPILDGICWAVGAQAVIIMLQLVGLDPICLNDSKTGMNTHCVGLYGFKFVFGAWMALVTPVLLFNKRYIFGALSFIMCVLAMSIAPIGLMIASLVAGVVMVNKKYLIPIVVFAIIVSGLAWFLVLDNPTNQTLYHKVWLRVHLESKFLPIVFQKPITGWGLGSFKYIGSSVWNPNTGTYGTMVDAWNDYLQQAVECGLPFVVLFICMCIDVFKKFMRKRGENLIGVFCSLSIIPLGIMFHNYMGHPSLNVLMLCLLSAFFIQGGYNESS